MRGLALLAVPVALAAQCAPASGMVGGALPADEALARHVVMVVGAGRPGCSGTVIGRDLVLTAAHCVPPGSLYGVVEAGAGRHATPNRAVRIERPPLFDFDSAHARRETADVALVKLIRPLSARAMPAPLGARDHFLLGDRFIVAGYGVNGFSTGGYGTLRWATLMVVVRHAGSGSLLLADPATRGELAGLGACTGDSGGPVFEDTGNRLALVGVVSWVTGPLRSAGCGAVTGATPLVHFRRWITQTAGKLGSRIP